MPIPTHPLFFLRNIWKVPYRNTSGSLDMIIIFIVQVVCEERLKTKTNTMKDLEERWNSKEQIRKRVKKRKNLAEDIDIHESQRIYLGTIHKLHKQNFAHYLPLLTIF